MNAIYSDMYSDMVFCEGDIMIIIGFMIDDDFVAGGRCDNWVGSLFGGSQQGGTCKPSLFHPPPPTQH